MADGPARFTQGFTCPALLRIPLSITLTYPYGTITPFGPTFQMVPVHCASNVVVLQPHYCRNNNGLGSSAFARRYSQNHYCFLLLRLLRCFSSPGLPPIANAIGYYVFNIVGCPIRTPADHFVCANPRGFSQLIASFIASESLGIPHTPLLSLSPRLIITYSYFYLYSYLKKFVFSKYSKSNN